MRFVHWLDVSSSKFERFYQTIKCDCIRVQTPLSIEEARRIVEKFVKHYNETRLHSAIGYVSPKARLESRDIEVPSQGT